MKKINKQILQKYLDRRLFTRLRLLTILSLIMLVIIAFEVLENKFNIPLALSGILLGLVVGIIASRMYHLSWDEETSKVIGRIDWIGAIILLLYIIFMIARILLLGYLVQGAPLFTTTLSITAGAMMGRIVGTRHGIHKILKDLENLRKLVD